VKFINSSRMGVVSTLKLGVAFHTEASEIWNRAIWRGGMTPCSPFKLNLNFRETSPLLSMVGKKAKQKNRLHVLPKRRLPYAVIPLVWELRILHLMILVCVISGKVLLLKFETSITDPACKYAYQC
jgi:hypothetical protein